MHHVVGGFTLRSIILLCLVSLLLVSCSPGKHSGNVASAEIRFWNGFTGPDGATMEKIVQQFERETGIRVKMQIIPWSTYYDKLLLSLAYGGAPDVFICHANRIAEFARYGVFRPLDDLIEADKGFNSSDFLPNIWKAGQYAGKQVGLPLDCHPARAVLQPEAVPRGRHGGRAGQPQTACNVGGVSGRRAPTDEGQGSATGDPTSGASPSPGYAPTGLPSLASMEVPSFRPT
jgi:hypothetical protein